jgi:hypothetical protein
MPKSVKDKKLAKSQPSVAGVYDHAGWAVVVCVAGREVIDRRRIALKEDGLPSLPHHHQGQRLPLPEGVALVARVRASAELCARNELDALPASVRIIAIRARPKLPPTVEERITSYWAQTRSDGVMYRDALAEAAARRGWTVAEYDTRTVLAEAAEALGLDDISPLMKQIGATLGPPWTLDHRLATAAAIVAAHAP